MTLPVWEKKQTKRDALLSKRTGERTSRRSFSLFRTKNADHDADGSLFRGSTPSLHHVCACQANICIKLSSRSYEVGFGIIGTAKVAF
jgi:hypothetical protein